MRAFTGRSSNPPGTSLPARWQCATRFCPPYPFMGARFALPCVFVLRGAEAAAIGSAAAHIRSRFGAAVKAAAGHVIDVAVRIGPHHLVAEAVALRRGHI